VSIVLTYRDASWTEVKDGQGQVLVAQMIPGGQTRSIAGVPPLTVVIGNASEVSATQRGQLLDLVPVTQKNVARFIID
jgi:cytoskeleton protein RodZ